MPAWPPSSASGARPSAWGAPVSPCRPGLTSQPPPLPSSFRKQPCPGCLALGGQQLGVPTSAALGHTGARGERPCVHAVTYFCDACFLQNPRGLEKNIEKLPKVLKLFELKCFIYIKIEFLIILLWHALIKNYLSSSFGQEKLWSMKSLLTEIIVGKSVSVKARPQHISAQSWSLFKILILRSLNYQIFLH